MDGQVKRTCPRRQYLRCVNISIITTLGSDVMDVVATPCIVRVSLLAVHVLPNCLMVTNTYHHSSHCSAFGGLIFLSGGKQSDRPEKN